MMTLRSDAEPATDGVESKDAYQKALETAAAQLSYRALSAQMLEKKLRDKGHSEECATYAVAWLTERGLIDDSAFAESVARSYIRRGYGPGRIRQELYRRGVEREIADAVLEGYSGNEDAILALLEKRLKGDLSDRKAVDKAVAALQRRGFSWQEIRKGLDVYGTPVDDVFE